MIIVSIEENNILLGFAIVNENGAEILISKDKLNNLSDYLNDKFGCVKIKYCRLIDNFMISEISV